MGNIKYNITFDNYFLTTSFNKQYYYVLYLNKCIMGY